MCQSLVLMGTRMARFLSPPFCLRLVDSCGYKRIDKLPIVAVDQIRLIFGDNLGIIFDISPQKHMLWPWVPSTYVFIEN